MVPEVQGVVLGLESQDGVPVVRLQSEGPQVSDFLNRWDEALDMARRSGEVVYMGSVVYITERAMKVNRGHKDYAFIARTMHPAFMQPKGEQ